MVRRKADGAWIAVEVVEPQRLPLDQDNLEQPVANGNRADPLPLLGGDARSEERFDPTPVAEERERTVAGADEVTGAVDDLLQDGLEIELTENAEPGIVQRQELLVLLRELHLEPADDTEDGLGEEERAEEDDASQEELTGPALEKGGRDDLPRQLERSQEEQRRQDGEQLEATKCHRS